LKNFIKHDSPEGNNLSSKALESVLAVTAVVHSIGFTRLELVIGAQQHHYTDTIHSQISDNTPLIHTYTTLELHIGMGSTVKQGPLNSVTHVSLLLLMAVERPRLVFSPSRTYSLKTDPQNGSIMGVTRLAQGHMGSGGRPTNPSLMTVTPELRPPRLIKKWAILGTALPP